MLFRSVNEALLRLDAIVQLAVIERNRDTPPAAPANGDRYIVGAAPTGAFVGHAGAVASFDAGGWNFLAPGVGWCAYVIAENALLAFDGSGWSATSSTGGITELQNLVKLGLGTMADGANPLAVKVNNALFAAESTPSGTGDLRFKLNKDAAANTVSQLYQTGYSGRAETGLMGDEQYAIKVSADGATWKQALVIDPTSGVVDFPFGATGAGGGGGGAASGINALVNVGLSASVAGGALTVDLKTAALAAPSGSDTVMIPFRSATASSGSVATREVATPTSLTLSSGSTLGVAAINTPFALWIVAFDDGGTVRLGIINCLSGENIFPLGRGSPIASSTAEGGAGGADSAHVFYTGAAVASKPYVVLGRLEWSSGLATLGTWTAPTNVAVYSAGMKLPGDLVQIASDRYTANAALSTSIPNDDTVPTSTEGTQIVSATLTPTSAANRIHARFAGPFDSTSAIYAYAALFNGGSAAIGTVMSTINGNGYPTVLAMERAQAASSTSSQTWSVRVGGSSAIYANGLSSGRKLGGSMGVTLIVSEVQA